MSIFNQTRRRLLGLGAGICACSALGLAATRQQPQVWNACHASLSPNLAAQPFIEAAWQGLDPAQVWDCHVHIAGMGDDASGITITPEMTSLRHPSQYAQRLFYLNAGCAHDAPGHVDRSYVERMLNLLEGMPAGVKLMLFAFDRAHDAQGKPLPERSALYVPNAYAQQLARDYPDRFEWVASLHPYRADAIAALEQAVADGARAIKWLPSAMGIDPAAPQCADFYRALARLDLPLISHAGSEKAVHGFNRPEYNNPLHLRHALDAGVRVVIAHCASTGTDADLDHGGRKVASFDLFASMMMHPAHRTLLFADISAITQRNRPLKLIRTLLERSDWHARLLNGTDYPLPGVLPLFSPAEFARAGMLDPALVAPLNDLQNHNPLLFDFVLKRNLVANGQRLPDRIFATRTFFDRKSA